MVAIISSHQSFSQAKDAEGIIIWAENRKLSLNDFIVVADSTKLLSPQTAALTRTGITYSLSASKGKKNANVQMKVYATVHTANTYIKKSRLQMQPQRVAYLLNHEQKHFDISEIYAREATRDLLQKKATKNYRKEFAHIMQMKFKQAEAWQRLYDAQTDNGRDTTQQQEWDEKIAARLKNLTRYKNKMVEKVVVF